MQKTIVIIPCYNESQRINRKIFSSFLTQNPSITLFFVDDGSVDDTYEVLNTLAENNENARVYRLEKNQGKANAIRLSVNSILKNQQCDYIGYFDADLSTPLDYIVNFKKILDESSVQAVIGSRIKRLGSHISRNPLRHIFGRIVATIASLVLELPVYDTQCGAKLFKVVFIKDSFAEPFCSKWLFDIELFARLKKIHGRDIILNSIREEPLEEWIDDGNTRIKTMDFIRIPVDLVKIAMKYYKRRTK